MSRLAFLLAMIAGALHGPALAQAQAWPQKPVRVLVGLAPGGNPDTLARMLAAKWGAAFGQQFVVENRPGAGSTIAADLAAKSAPDGYTVLISDSSVITTAPHLFKSLPYDPFRDLQAVSLAVVVPMWLVVHPSVPANSVAELVALAKSRKDAMPYASSGNGSIHHITMELFKAETGANFTHVPFKGAGQSVPAMIAGDVQLGFIGYPAAAGAIRAESCACSRSAWRGAQTSHPRSRRSRRRWRPASTWRPRWACSSSRAPRARSLRGSAVR